MSLDVSIRKGLCLSTDDRRSRVVTALKYRERYKPLQQTKPNLGDHTMATRREIDRELDRTRPKRYSMRVAPNKRQERGWIKDQVTSEALPRRAAKQRKWQAYLGTKTTRPCPGNVGELAPREAYPAPTVSGPVLNPYTGPKIFKSKNPKNPEQFKRGKKMGSRQKPSTQIVAIIPNK